MFFLSVVPYQNPKADFWEVEFGNEFVTKAGGTFVSADLNRRKNQHAARHNGFDYARAQTYICPNVGC
jgi:hypothetical protein